MSDYYFKGFSHDEEAGSLTIKGYAAEWPEAAVFSEEDKILIPTEEDSAITEDYIFTQLMEPDETGSFTFYANTNTSPPTLRGKMNGEVNFKDLGPLNKEGNRHSLFKFNYGGGGIVLIGTTDIQGGGDQD